MLDEMLLPDRYLGDVPMKPMLAFAAISVSAVSLAVLVMFACSLGGVSELHYISDGTYQLVYIAALLLSVVAMAAAGTGLVLSARQAGMARWHWRLHLLALLLSVSAIAIAVEIDEVLTTEYLLRPFFSCARSQE